MTVSRKWIGGALVDARSIARDLECLGQILFTLNGELERGLQIFEEMGSIKAIRVGLPLDEINFCIGQIVRTGRQLNQLQGPE